MNEPLPVPPEIKSEAAHLDHERTQSQLMESLILVRQLMAANQQLDNNARAFAAALVEIRDIKGSPPIQVARTIANKAIDKVMAEIHGEAPTDESPPQRLLQ